jgi:hypothetical protein
VRRRGTACGDDGGGGVMDFCVRRQGNLFWVWQAEGKRYVRVETPHFSRYSAIHWIADSKKDPAP